MSEFVKIIICLVFCLAEFAMWKFGLWGYNKVLFSVISVVFAYIGFKLWLD